MAAALAGVASFQACTVNNNNTTGDDQAGGESNGGKNTAGSSMTAAGADEGGASTGVGGSSGTVGGADEGGAAQGGSSVGGADEGGAAQGGAAACDDSVGEPSCDNVSADCESYCNAAVANLKPAAAVDAITCLEAVTTDFCDVGYQCLTAATAKGCPEDVTAACTAAETACTSPDANDPPCAQLLSGLNEAARAEAITCTEESCFSVYSCAEGLFFE